MITIDQGRFPEVQYVEGFAATSGNFPTHHGWLTFDGVHAVDPTWRAEFYELQVEGAARRDAGCDDAARTPSQSGSV
jgi:hypothetical protein